ncbi:MAG: indole-3-glycerol phosphate synthase TrpC [Oscillospiraceae bacterium]|nr:indole-3-glycerol phosphate synthase TrpC [Oscillospiraceae bacterium]
MILDDIVLYRKEQLKREKRKISPVGMEWLASECQRIPLDFKAAISAPGINIISEVKKASPSKGIISADFHPVETAVGYEKSGAAAISVLTEEHYFMGSGEYLQEIRKAVNIPLLRKDFIIDPYQIYEAKVLGADAVLLIAALLSADEMREYIALAKSLGLAALCESHNREELEICLCAGAEIFGINNRNLKTFEVSLDITAELSKLVPEGAVLVSESGMFTEEDIRKAAMSGANAALIGESLMRDPTLLRRLKGASI